jgi:hypothetical protein
MVSPIENRSELSGVVQARAMHARVERWDVLRVRLTDVGEVSGYANLLAGRIGDEVDIAVDRSELPDGSLAGYRFQGLATLAGPDVVRLVPAGADPPSDMPSAGPPAMGAMGSPPPRLSLTPPPPGDPLALSQ